MRGTPRLLAATAATTALLQAACMTGGKRVLQGSTAIYCYLQSTHLITTAATATCTGGVTGQGGKGERMRGVAACLPAVSAAAATRLPLGPLLPLLVG